MNIGASLMKSRLFFASYSPLFAIFAIRSHDVYIEVLWGAAALLGIANMALIIMEIGSLEANPYDVTSFVDRGPDAAGYLAAYLLPFVTVAIPSTRDVVAYGVFIGVMGLIYVNSSLIAINPAFYVLGYRVGLLKSSSGFEAFLVYKPRHRPKPGATVHAKQLAPGVLII